jgi:hypothetical protein
VGCTAASSRRSEITSLSIIRLLLLVQVASFATAALIHFGFLLEGYRDQGAAVPESIIAIVLLGGLALSWTPGPWPRRAAIAAQVFALLGTLVGTTLIAIGVGPRTALDVAFHITFLAELIVGLTVTLRAVE